MAKNPFDEFDQSGNPFDEFDAPTGTVTSAAMRPGGVMVNPVAQRKPVQTDIPVSNPAPVNSQFPTLKTSPTEDIFLKTGLKDPGMQPGTDFMASIAKDPAGFVKSIPGAAATMLGEVGKIPYQAWSMAANAALGQGDVSASDVTDKYIADLSKSNPVLGVAAKLSKGTAEMAPMLGIGALPKAAQSLIARGFTADMIYHAPGTAKALYDEYQKPASERDQDKITSLWSDGLQQVVFGGLGVKHEIGNAKQTAAALIGKYVPRGAGVNATPPPPVSGKVLSLPAGAKPTGLYPALKVGDQIVTGGDSHDEVAKNAPDPEAAQEALKDDANHVFQDDSGNIHNRSQAAVKFDESQGNPPGTTKELHSTDLAKAQKKADDEQRRRLETEPSNEPLSAMAGKLGIWNKQVGTIRIDEDGRPILEVPQLKGSKIIELPHNAETKASDAGFEPFKRQLKDRPSAPAAIQQQQTNPAQPVATPKGLSPEDLPGAMQELGDTISALREQIRKSGFQPDPTSLKLIDAVSKTASKKDAALSQQYGALESVPTVKRLLNGIIGRLEAEGRHDETEPFYDHLSKIEQFENKYLEAVTAPAKTRGKAKTADIVPPISQPEVEAAKNEPAGLPRPNADVPASVANVGEAAPPVQSELDKIKPLTVTAYKGAPVHEYPAVGVFDTEDEASHVVDTYHPDDDAMMAKRGDKYVVFAPKGVKPIRTVEQAIADTTPVQSENEPENIRILTDKDTEFAESLASKYGHPVKPSIPSVEPYESLSRFGDTLERSADKSQDEAELSKILDAAKGLPESQESRIAWSVLNNPHTSAEVYAKAKTNESVRKDTSDENINRLDARRAELRKQRGLDQPSPPLTKEPVLKSPTPEPPISEASKPTATPTAESVPQKGAGAKFKRPSPPQVAQPMISGGSLKLPDGTLGKSVLIPGFEEYYLALVKPSGNKAKGTKQGWRVVEATTGKAIAHPLGKLLEDSQQSAMAETVRVLNHFGKAKIDELIQKYSDPSLVPEKLSTPARETITPSEDTPIGQNAAGEKLYQRKDGSVYRIEGGKPNFGGDLVQETSSEPTPTPKLPEPATKPAVEKVETPKAQEAQPPKSGDEGKGGYSFGESGVRVGKVQVSRKVRPNGDDITSTASIDAPINVTDSKNWPSVNPDHLRYEVFARGNFDKRQAPKKTEKVWRVYNPKTKETVATGLSFNDAVVFAKTEMVRRNFEKPEPTQPIPQGPGAKAEPEIKGMGGAVPGEPPPNQKYRVSSQGPQLHTLVEKLHATPVEIANGEQPVRVRNEKTGAEFTTLEKDLTPVKEATEPKPKVEKESLDDQLRSVGLDPSVFPDAKSKQAALKRQEAIKPRFGKGGPGAAAGGEPGTYSAIQQMSDNLRATAGADKPLDEQVSAIQKAKDKLADIKDYFKKSAATVKAVADALWNRYRSVPEFGDEKRAVGKWFAAVQQADHEARQFAKQIIKEVPDKLRREAITNWIQADGDTALLKERESASEGSLKRGYQIAQNLTDREKYIAQSIREYYDRQLENGIEAGLLKDGLEQYITQVWKKENPITKKLLSDLSYGKLTPNFRFARKRIFDSYFEGEQAGYTPQKDAGFLVANYDQTFNRALAARAFIKDLHEAKASDGRPLVELSGSGRKIEGDAGGGGTRLIRPHAKPEELKDYQPINHPALRGWKFAGTEPDGTTILQEGDMLVHPEAYNKLLNRLSVSKIRKNPVGRAVLRLQGGIKQNMLSLSGFHQVQEGLHALGHRVNPTNLEPVDFSEPVTKALSEHGLQLADYNALADFGEGLAGGGLSTKLPVVGPRLHAYNEWLFQDYIPRLKLKMAKVTLDRNRQHYPNMSEDQLLELSAGQANSAFGELPYKYWGRNPTLQDFWRTVLLAPDFLESRARFVGGALRKGQGHEQLMALGLLAVTQYMTARIVNQILDKDPHWEMKNAFKIIVGGHSYGLRSIPGDILHLVSDPRGFVFNRIAPVTRVAFEAITGRDDRGVKRDFMGQVKDALQMPVPLPLKSKRGQSWWEQFMNSFGVQEQRYDAVQNIDQKIADWKKSNGITSPVDIVYDAEKDKFAALRAYLENGDRAGAQKEYDRLKTQIPPQQIAKHFKQSLERPLTGSKANDAKFYQSLDEAGKDEFKQAKALKDARYHMVLELNSNGTPFDAFSVKP